MPNYLAKYSKLTISTVFALSITACSTPMPQKDKTTPPKVTISEAKKPVIEAEQDLLELTLDNLQLMRNKAANSGDWVAYIDYSNAAWAKSSANEQQQIEEQVWSILNSLSNEQRDTIAQTEKADIQAWNELYRVFQGDKKRDSIALMNLKQFDADAPFNKHLLTTLITQQPTQSDLKQLAVLLPMQGKYKVISQQIRSGIVKAFLASQRDITLKFYDSSDLNELETTYTLAKQEGADRIIGPLRKEAVQLLASFHDNSMLALNSVEQATIPQFNFKSASPEMQMRNRFAQLGFKRIGIMTNDKPKNVADAKTLQNLWHQDPSNHAEISIYPNERPKLREALGKLIHEDNSKERRNNIRWTVNDKVEYFPRTRQDLDAIVIFDSAQRLAVFRPQFDFFGLQVPMYSDSKLTPRNFQQSFVNKDLREIRFLSYPAVLSPADLVNKFEAFGWDSFLVSTHLDDLQNGACLTNAKTGILSMQGAEVRQHQIWLTFNRQGELEEAPNIDKITVTQP